MISVAAKVAGGISLPDVFSGVGDIAALNKLIGDCASAVAVVGGVDLPTIFDAAVETSDGLLGNKERLETVSARLGPICDGAIDGLSALLAANSASPSSFDLQHVVLEGRGHCWLCSECCRLPGVADGVVGRTGESGGGGGSGGGGHK